MIRKIVCATVGIVLVAGCLAGCISKNKCTLNVETSYGGTGEGGEQLASGSFSETLVISEGDAVYEKMDGHYTTDKKGMNSFEIAFKVKSIGKEEVIIVSGEEEIAVPFGTKKNMDSIIFVADGVNYQHNITFDKTK